MAPAAVTFDESIDYYEFLSIPSDATDAEIQRAYRRTNLKYHPDKFKATSEISAEQAAAKLDLLQNILTVLKDPAQRAAYDKSREGKRRKAAEAQNYDLERKRKVVELGDREAKAAYAVNGVKKPKAEDKRALTIAEENREAARRIMKQRQEEQARLRNAAEAQRRKDTPPETDENHRSVKVTWVKEGDGLDIDAAALEEMCAGFGPVEGVRVLKDKKRRIDGRKGKTVFGIALVVFGTLSAAQDAVEKGPWGGVESVEWVFKDTDPV